MEIFENCIEIFKNYIETFENIRKFRTHQMAEEFVVHREVWPQRVGRKSGYQIIRR